jgi:predicted CopG family antitoxin
MSKRITIGLRDDIYLKLKDKGKFGESFSDLVSRMLLEIDNKRKIGEKWT